jgi:hypothetical protein
VKLGPFSPLSSELVMFSIFHMDLKNTKSMKSSAQNFMYLVAVISENVGLLMAELKYI